MRNPSQSARVPPWPTNTTKTTGIHTSDRARKPSLCSTSDALWSMYRQHVSQRLRSPYMLAMSKIRQTLWMFSTAFRYSDIADCSSTKPYWLARPRTSNSTSSCNETTTATRHTATSTTTLQNHVGEFRRRDHGPQDDKSHPFCLAYAMHFQRVFMSKTVFASVALPEDAHLSFRLLASIFGVWGLVRLSWLQFLARPI